MAHVPEARFVREWLTECGRKDPLFREGLWCSGEFRAATFGLWHDEEGNLQQNRLTIVDGKIIFRGRLGVMSEVAEIELARFIGRRDGQRIINKRTGEWGGCVLLNGDGFDEGVLQGIQARIRQRCTNQINISPPMIIPHQALAGAQVPIESVRRVSVARDSHDSVEHTFPLPEGDTYEQALSTARGQARAQWEDYAKDKHRNERGFDTWRSFESQFVSFTHARFEWRVSVRVSVAPEHFVAKALDQHRGTVHVLKAPWQNTPLTERISFRIHFQPENGVRDWQNVRQDGDVIRLRVGVHRLGASVFTGFAPDGLKHRFLSAFDSNENPPMFFLAQLPDRGRVLTYQQAIDSLAPPIVHEARRLNKLVFRQGDVFFIETSLTDWDVLRRKGVIVTVESPRQMIYGTAHVATRVARFRNGVTLANGVAMHRPYLESPGREPEHRDLHLDGAVWHLCVRNQVPRIANGFSTDSSSLTATAPPQAQNTITQRRELQHV